MNCGKQARMAVWGWLGWCCCCAVSGTAAEPLSAEALAKLRARVETLAADRSAEAFRPLRGELLQHFSDGSAGPFAERLVDLLLELPPEGENPPQPPAFPFSAEAAAAYQRDYARWAGLPVAFRNAQGMRLVLVPPGVFWMGSPPDDPHHGHGGFDETRHRVRLTAPFYLAAHETTVGQFRQFVEATAYDTDARRRGGGHAHDEQAVWEHRPGVHWRDVGFAGPYAQRDDHPVVHVSHNDTAAFCRWLNRTSSLSWVLRYDLPTEAQWEWACRAGSAARYWWGDRPDDTGRRVNAGDRALKALHPRWPRQIMPMDDGHAYVAPVGSYQANGFGLYDLLGNVWEFCSTRTGAYPRGESVDPGDLDPRRGFAVRGGGWSNEPHDLRCATRNADPPDFCHSNLGFRVALRLPDRLEAARPKTPLLVDADLDGPGDLLAVALALVSPEVQLRGLSVLGEDVRTRGTMACRFLHNVGRGEIPVALGAAPERSRPHLDGIFQYGRRPAYKGPRREPAAEHLAQLLEQAPRPAVVVVLGPLTHVAAVLKQRPAIRDKMVRVIATDAMADDPTALAAVLHSGVELLLVPDEAVRDLRAADEWRSQFAQSRSAVVQELKTLFELAQSPPPGKLAEALAVALAIDADSAPQRPARLEIDEAGNVQLGAGQPNVRVAGTPQRDLAARTLSRLLEAQPQWRATRRPPAPRTELVPPGNLPRKVHVFEDYETDIERRWWLAGRLETENVPPGSTRACRATRTRDFDDRQGDMQARYRAVIFNPVPGPPMGPQTRLSFRYWLRGTDRIRIQIYSLSNGYHRQMVLAGLPQGSWQSAAVDMTVARQPHGTGGPLSENERIDDIQFYIDEGAELIIDDIVLYDAAPAEETRPFPRRLVFTGWFDTGRQGVEWPGTFDMVPHQAPRTWKGARSVDDPQEQGALLRVGLRGDRPLGKTTRLQFAYHLTKAAKVEIRLCQGEKVLDRMTLEGGPADTWRQAEVEFAQVAGGAADAVEFRVGAGAVLTVDDLLLYEPGEASR